MCFINENLISLIYLITFESFKVNSLEALSFQSAGNFYLKRSYRMRYSFPTDLENPKSSLLLLPLYILLLAFPVIFK